MNEIVQELKIENMIYEIRGKQVMLDSDLAKLYQCKNGTKVINQSVSRHLDRFPDDFYFKLTEEEFKNLRSQLVTTNEMSRTLPYVFTEQGVAMLATILRTSVAAEVSIKIMRAFVIMKKYISSNLLEQKYVNNLVMKHEEQINTLFDFFNQNKAATEIYFKGQIYDAYSKIIDIFFLAEKELIIIDSYADKYVLDMISKVNVSVTIVLSTDSRLSTLDIDKYRKEYNNLTLIYNDSFHDRFIILDKKEMYHLGTSINNAGTKTFAINKVEDKRWLNSVIEEITNNKKDI
jgi:hypothetical protein